MTLTLGLTRDADMDTVILTGWTDPAPPQIIIRERVQGRFLTGRGWQPRSGFAPLVPVPGFPGGLALQVPSGSLPGDTRIQLEIPAISHRQEAKWPKPPDPPVTGPAPSLQPGAPPVAPPLRTEPPSSSPPKRATLRLLTLSLTATIAFATGGASGWLITWSSDQEEIQQLQAARETRSAALLQEKEDLLRREAALGTDRQRLLSDQQALAASRAQLEADRNRLLIDQQTLATARSQLEADQAKLASDQQAFQRERQSQPPPSAPPVATGWLPAPSAGPAPAPLTPAPTPSTQEAALQCDLLAANPFDRNRSPDTPGVTMPTLRANAAAAIAACKQASDVLPMQLRFTYQHARALQNTDPDQAFQLFAALARQRYPAAFDNMAWIILSRGGDRDQAAQLLREGAAMGDADASFTLGMLIKDGAVPARPGENPQALLQRAAQQGHQGAQAVLNNMPPPVPPFPWLFGKK